MSRSVRKSIVPKSRSIAGGPQIFAPIARYARNKMRLRAKPAGVIASGYSKFRPRLCAKRWLGEMAPQLSIRAHTIRRIL